MKVSCIDAGKKDREPQIEADECGSTNAVSVAGSICVYLRASAVHQIITIIS
jgi:hypothetical protein